MISDWNRINNLFVAKVDSNTEALQLNGLAYYLNSLFDKSEKDNCTSSKTASTNTCKFSA